MKKLIDTTRIGVITSLLLALLGNVVPSRGGTSWNDGEMPPFPRDDEAEVREAVFFEGVSRDILVHYPLASDGYNSLYLSEYFRYEDRLLSGDLMFVPAAFLSLYPASGDDVHRVEWQRDGWFRNFSVAWEKIAQARRLEARRLEFLRRLEEHRVLSELGLETDAVLSDDLLRPAEISPELDAGYYTEEGLKLLVARNIPRGMFKDVDNPEILTQRLAELRNLIMSYWGIPKGAPDDIWPWYIRETERKMRGLNEGSLTGPSHLEFLFSVGEYFLRKNYYKAPRKDEAYRCWAVVWIRQCQALQELSAHIMALLHRSGLEREYLEAVRGPGPLGERVTPREAYRAVCSMRAVELRRTLQRLSFLWHIF